MIGIIYSFYTVMDHIFIEKNTLSYRLNAIITVFIGFIIILVRLVMDWMFLGEFCYDV